MPPKGLYAMPRHHQYGGPSRRQSFNSNSFVDSYENDFREKPMPGSAKKKTDDEAEGKKKRKKEKTDDEAAEKKRRKQEKKERKEKKKRESMTNEADTDHVRRDAAVATPDTAAKKADKQQEGGIVAPPTTPATPTHKKSDKKAKKSGEKAAAATPSSKKKDKEKEKQSSLVQATNEDVQSSAKKKKRKRESEVNTATPTTSTAKEAPTSTSGGFLIGADLVEKIANDMKGSGDFTEAVSTDFTPSLKASPKKKLKQSKLDAEQTHDAVTKEITPATAVKAKEKKGAAAIKASRPVASSSIKASKVTPGPLPQNFFQSSPLVASGPTRVSKAPIPILQGVSQSSPLVTSVPARALSKTPIPLPQNVSESSPLVASTLAKVPRQTPIPIPQNVSESLSLIASSLNKASRQTPIPIPQVVPHGPTSQPTKTSTTSASPSKEKNGVLVPETPPSKPPRFPNIFNVSPLPFKPYWPASSASAGRPPISTPTIHSDATSQSAINTSTRHKTPIPLPKVSNALTSANLARHTEPLNDEPKPRPRARGKAAPSSTTSSMSIKDFFARSGKRLTSQPEAEDPITDFSPGKQAPQTPKPASLTLTLFNTQYTALQSTISFLHEDTYLESYLTHEVAAAATALSCLGKTTGCTAKKEEILRLAREENLDVDLAASFMATDYNPSLLHAVGMRARNAEEFLMLAVRARVPVPLGPVEGTWTLYCPRYAEVHFDRYGYGQRELSISRIAGGLSDRATFTARLKVPPRSMLYTSLAFKVPSHASFRAVGVQTSAEGYQMEIVFLGNGYLVLRADLRELLLGRRGEGEGAAEGEGKKGWMTFLGVHQMAVEWFSEE